mgnify:CR=1 FL=1
MSNKAKTATCNLNCNLFLYILQEVTPKLQSCSKKNNRVLYMGKTALHETIVFRNDVLLQPTILLFFISI